MAGNHLLERLRRGLEERYTIEGEIGRGGMATVYRANDRRHGRAVALKVMDPAITGTLGAERFLREIEIAARLTHPHLVPLYDSGSLSGAGGHDADVLYYVMPFIKGESLRDRLNRDGALSPAEVGRIVREVASALDYAHREGVVHRDIKPENILLSDGLAVVADFGVARAVVEASGGTTLTQLGTVVGTPTYMAPEQAGGDEVDGRADQYSLACVAYELLTGRPPFTGSNPMAVISQHLTATPPPLHATQPVPDDVERAIHRAMAKEPHGRHASAIEFATAINTVEVEQPPMSVRLPSGTLPQRPRLPTPLTPLVGRDADVRKIVSLLQREGVRLLTLHGPGGIGKSRLAVEAASRIADAFPGGVYFVALAEITDASLLGTRVAQVLGLRDAVIAHDALRDHLRQRRALLVLDNFEQIVETGAMEVASLLADCPGLKVLITSQVVLRVYGEHEYPVEPLALPPAHIARPSLVESAPAVRLFVERAVAAKPDFRLTEENAAAVVGICIRLDGVPLAIELAAARVKVMPPQQLLPRLEQTLDMLTGGARDLPPRQRTMRGAIAWSHDALTSEQQVLFRRLAVFGGGATAGMGAAVCGDDTPRELAEEQLALLAEHSLLRASAGDDGMIRFHMLRPVRVFAAEMLAAAGEAAAMADRHARIFAALAAEAEPYTAHGDGVWLDRLEAEHDNMRAALDHLARVGESERALQMALSLWRFWNARSYAREGLDRLQALLAARGAPADSPLRGAALFAAGALADTCMDYAAGRRFFEQHVAHVERIGDERALMLARNNLAVLLLRQGDADAAVPLLESVVADIRRTGDLRGAALGVTNIGSAEQLRRRFATARARYLEALGLFTEVGDSVDAAWVQNHLGKLARAEGNVDEARARFNESAATFASLGHGRALATVLMELAELTADEGQLAEAHALLEEALTHVAEAGDQHGMLRVIEILAGVASSQGADERALRLAGAVAGLREALGTPLSTGDRERMERRLAAAVARLGAEESERAWERGLPMSMEEVLRLLATPEPRPSEPHLLVD